MSGRKEMERLLTDALGELQEALGGVELGSIALTSAGPAVASAQPEPQAAGSAPTVPKPQMPDDDDDDDDDADDDAGIDIQVTGSAELRDESTANSCTGPGQTAANASHLERATERNDSMPLGPSVAVDVAAVSKLAQQRAGTASGSSARGEDEATLAATGTQASGPAAAAESAGPGPRGGAASGQVFDPLGRGRKSRGATSAAAPGQQLPRQHAQKAGTSAATGGGREKLGGSSGDAAGQAPSVTQTVEALQQQLGAKKAPQPSGSFPAADLPAGLSEDMVDELVKGLLGEGGAGGGGQGDGTGLFDRLAESIMTSLLSKDLLYEPLTEIATKYPPWLEKNRSKLSPEEASRYERQLSIVQEMCGTYETQPDNSQLLLTLLQEMQRLGEPPQEILEELAPDGTEADAGSLIGSIFQGVGGQQQQCNMQQATSCF